MQDVSRKQNDIHPRTGFLALGSACRLPRLDGAASGGGSAGAGAQGGVLERGEDHVKAKPKQLARKISQQELVFLLEAAAIDLMFERFMAGHKLQGGGFHNLVNRLFTRLLERGY